MKINRILIFFVFVSIIVLTSCNRFLYSTTEKELTFEYNFEKYEPYLSIDSVYKTQNGKEKFEGLKSELLSVVFDTSNCYLKRKLTGDWVVRNYYVDNILHSQNYDSLLVLLILDRAILDNYGNVQTWGKKKNPYSQVNAIPVRVIIDKNGKWNFNCKPIIFGIDQSPITEKSLEIVRLSLKRAIIRASYFKKDLQPDPTFWHRLFTDPNIFFPDPYKDGFPLN